MTQLILVIPLWGVLPLIEKDFDTCMVLLFMRRKDFLLHLYLENSANFYLFFWLALLCSLSYYFSLYWSLSLSLCTVFDAISSNTVDVLSINPSAVFVFGDFNIIHKDWLTYSDGTDRPGGLCWSQMTLLRWLTLQIPDCNSHSPALLDLFISSDASICSTMAFPQLGSFHFVSHVVVSVSINFLTNSKGCPILSHSLWLFLCCLGRSSWSFERCSMGGYF